MKLEKKKTNVWCLYTVFKLFHRFKLVKQSRRPTFFFQITNFSIEFNRSRKNVSPSYCLVLQYLDENSFSRLHLATNSRWFIFVFIQIAFSLSGTDPVRSTLEDDGVRPRTKWADDFASAVHEIPYYCGKNDNSVKFCSYFVQDLHHLVVGVLLSGTDQRYDFRDRRLEGKVVEFRQALSSGRLRAFKREI